MCGCPAMHRTFQRDLYLLKLRVAREYVKALDSVMIPVSVDSTEPIKLSAQVGQLAFSEVYDKFVKLSFLCGSES